MLLLLASCAADSVFSELIDYLLADADASGVNEHLASETAAPADERRGSDPSPSSESESTCWQSRGFGSHAFGSLRRAAR
eukprot:SAG11_NODE_21508_length_424_cov_0.550769_2_plen_79_part_01